ncbi:hypothetical protein Tco_0500002 [Tanacetum coccineum]
MDSEEGEKKAASSKKRPREEPDEESVKRQKIGETSGSGEEQSAEKEKELSEEELQKLLVVVPVEETYDTCGVHHVSSIRGHDIFMLVEKEYPLTRGTLGLIMVARLLVEEDSEMSKELLRKIFYQANRPRQSIQEGSTWKIYFAVLADIAECLRNAFGYEYGLSSLNGWTKRSAFWKERQVSTECTASVNLHVPLEEIKVDKTLCFVEEPVVIMDHEIKKLERSRVPIVKDRWNSKDGLELFGNDRIL